MNGAGGGRGCWFAVSRCFNSQQPGERKLYSKVSSENIEFEDLATSDRKALELNMKKQVVTEDEKEHVMNGKLDALVEQQRRIDEEKDAQLRRHEEALRHEEEAYYAAKRVAANRRHNQHRAPTTLEIEESDQSDVAFSFPMLHTPLVPMSLPMATSSTSLARGMTDTTREHDMMSAISVSGSHLTDSQAKDDDDFDQFLEIVKVKQLSFSKKNDTLPDMPAVAVQVSDSDEEIDFGFWEKAPDPGKAMLTSSDKIHLLHRPQDVKEADLGLL